MTVDLEVQTPLIRQAADVLDDASFAFDGTSEVLPCALTDAGLGASAVAREVVDAASRRVLQAAEAARRLSELVTDTARTLRLAATAFEYAESCAIAPPR